MSEWLPIILTSLLAGVPNLWRGREELELEYSRMPLLRPYLNGWHWFCLTIHLLFPAISFLLLLILGASLVAPLSELKPSFSLTLLLYALGFGITFPAIARRRPLELPTLGAIDVGKYYRNLLEYGYRQIWRGQKQTTIDFRGDLVRELREIPPKQLRERLQLYLEPYFEEVKADENRLLNPSEKIARAMSLSDRTQQATEIAALIRDVDRRDLPGILYRLKCDRTLSKYFPRWQPKIPRD